MTIGWRVKKEEDNSIQCSLVKAPVVFFEPIPRQEMELLMAKYPRREWLGYLVGKIEEGNFFVEGLSIPPHKEAGAASAEAEPFHIPDRCIGVIHSHNGMGAFHSGTDQDYVDKNFPVSVTVSKRDGNSLEFDTVSYQVTLCGKGTTVKGCVKYVQPEPPPIPESWFKEAVKNIKKGIEKRPVVRISGCNSGAYQRSLPYSGYKDFVTDERGRVIPMAEFQAHLDEIWGTEGSEIEGFGGKLGRRKRRE